MFKFFKDGKRISPPDLSYSENDPDAVMPIIRNIVEKAWEEVVACWNEDPNERPIASELASTFRELLHTASELPYERLMDYLRPLLTRCEGALTPRDVHELQQKQSAFYINPNQVIFTNHVLGSGNFGEVRKCQIWKQKNTGTNVGKEEYPEVAAKILFDSANNAKMVKEIDLIASLHHKNIVQFLHFTLKEDKLVLIMEYLQEGSLLKFVRSIDKMPDKNDRKSHYFTSLVKLIHDVAEGMCYLHSQKIIHCDLAARNVFLYKDTQHTITNIVAKVGDFGLAKFVKVDHNYYYSRSNNATTFPFHWTAPEYFFPTDREASHNKAIIRYEGDVWSYGVLLWEVFTLGLSPSKHFPTDENIKPKLMNGWRLPKKLIKFDDRVYTDLMLKCWEWDYKKRPSFHELKSNIQDLCPSLGNIHSFA